jgi:hypothetical protein
MGEAWTAVVMASIKDRVSPEVLRREIMSAVVGLDFVFVWFDIGLGMVVNGLISSSIEPGILKFLVPRCSDTQTAFEEIVQVSHSRRSLD